ncbi:uncharacterized protein LOC132612161 [Lycium barbarum]|uniref:uncharacterized protein LOC132612161 n=1 Tax=Lycium barbarum TaxID=112863 RepID=UPI00293F1FF8|nr:uncharacterized protein LOC132612161 [Lycium barbarum]
MIEIDDLQMWLQKWTPNFKHDEDLPTVLVWALLPGLSFHLHNWHYIKQIISDAGIPLELDLATKNLNRPSMAKVRIEIDILKPLIDNVWIGDEDEDSPLKGFVQRIKYENITKYCKHCRRLGHNLANCRVLEKRMQEEKKEVERENEHNNRQMEAEPMKNEPKKQVSIPQKNERDKPMPTNENVVSKERDVNETNNFDKEDHVINIDDTKEKENNDIDYTMINNNLKEMDDINDQGITVEHVEIVQDTNIKSKCVNQNETANDDDNAQIIANEINDNEPKSQIHVFLIKDHNELQVDIFGDDWQEVKGRKELSKEKETDNQDLGKVKDQNDKVQDHDKESSDEWVDGSSSEGEES